MAIKIGKPRKQKTWYMYTKSGKPIYTSTSIFNPKLEKEEHRVHARTFEPNLKIAILHLEKAKNKLGEECEWVEGKPTELMDVYF